MLKDENGDIQIISDFYEHKIQEILKLETGKKLEFTDFKEIESQKSKLVKNEESISFTFDETGLRNPLQFNIRTEELTVSENGNYTIERHLFEHKYEKHLIDQAQRNFLRTLKGLKKPYIKKCLKSKDYQKDKEIEKQFKNFLVDKNILQQSLKTIILKWMQRYWRLKISLPT